MRRYRLFLWGTVLWMLWGSLAFGADVVLVKGQYAEAIEICLKRGGIEYDALKEAEYIIGKFAFFNFLSSLVN